ncbi:amidase family protein [Mesorhizobium sp. M0062]|uniref:amidase family protein n=1 Tax=Mesorhizobium sp. M0062 TaxID=2956867 RepID=UPI0033389057
MASDPSLGDQIPVSAIDGQSLWFTHWPAIQNVSGQPSIALPVHVTDAGLPLGIQAVGRPGDEQTLLSLAAQMEKISGWLARRAPLKVPA